MGFQFLVELNGQHKVLRLANNREYIDEVLKVMELVGCGLVESICY